MRLAAVLAGLLLNAGFLEFVFHKSGWGVGWFAMLAGPLVWGVFLVYGGLLAPARLGLSARELVERVLGPWVGGLVWWGLVPAWLVSWFAYQTQMFTVGVRVWFLREGETWRGGLDNDLAVYWPWLILTMLPGWSSVPVRVAAVVLVAAPFAFREPVMQFGRYYGPGGCCETLWGLQGWVIWLAPALLWMGVVPGAGERTVRKGLVGIVLPLLLAAGLVWGVRLLVSGKIFTAVTALAGPYTQIGGVRLFLLASFTTVAAGRFCVDCAGEYLGSWRRWWTVGLVAVAMMVLGAWYWPYEAEWRVAAAPFVPLLGVIAGAYWARRSFVFGWVEQSVAVGAWAAGCLSWELPFVGWAVGFVLTGLGVRLCGARRFSRA